MRVILVDFVNVGDVIQYPDESGKFYTAQKVTITADGEYDVTLQEIGPTRAARVMAPSVQLTGPMRPRKQANKALHLLGVAALMFFGFIGLGVGMIAYDAYTYSPEAAAARNAAREAQVAYEQRSVEPRAPVHDDQQATTCRENSSSNVIAQAREAITTVLKAPSTASFPDVPSQGKTDHIGCGVYMVTVIVDAQNGFGAMIRDGYRVKIAYNPNTGYWDADTGIL